NVRASDNLAHAGVDNVRSSRRFIIDVKKPEKTDIVFDVTAYTTTTPATPQKQKVLTVPISGTIPSGEVGGVIKVYVDGVLKTSVPTTTTAWSASITLTPGTPQRVEVTFTDVAGNESDRKLYGYFLADGTAPVVTIDAAYKTMTTDKASVVITGSVSKDDWETYADLTLTVSPTTAALSYDTTTGKFTVSSGLSEGTNLIVVRAEDAVRNWDDDSATIERTVTPWATYAIIIVIVALVLAAIAIFRKR
ncbi:MAG: hypothetical protein QMD00_06045, partial [Hadesarchaea archaeon]|nr:hypothetical protein [Hadesarchaea archaeon]